MADKQNPAGQGGVCGSSDHDKIDPQDTRPSLPPQARRLLQNRRASTRFSFSHDGQNYCATVSRFDDGRLAEIFIDAAKQNSAVAMHANDAAILVSLLLQAERSDEVREFKRRVFSSGDVGGRA